MTRHQQNLQEYQRIKAEYRKSLKRAYFGHSWKDLFRALWSDLKNLPRRLLK